MTICSSDACVLKLSQSESFCTPSLSQKSLRSFAVRPRAVSIHADIRQPLSVCCLDESGSVQNKTCFWHSRLPRTSLPTSPGLILIVFPLTSERAGKNHTHHYGIFGFHPYIVPTHFLPMDTPTARALLSRVVGSIFRTADPPVLVSYVGCPWLAECQSKLAR